MKNKRMLDTYFNVGSDIKTFENEVLALKEATIVEKTYVCNYTFASVINVEKDIIRLLIIDNAFCQIFEEAGFFNTASKEIVQKFVLSVKRSDLEKNFGEAETNLIAKDTLLLLKRAEITDSTGKKSNRLTPYLIATDCYNTMLMRCGLSGLNKQFSSLIRNIMIAEAMINYDEVCTLIFRENNTSHKKLFSCLSSKYAYIPQDILLNIINELKNYQSIDCENYYVDNRVSYIYLNLQDKFDELKNLYNTDLIPGVFLSTSDTGDCSITAKAYFKKGKSIFTIGEVMRKHEGTVIIDELLDEITNSLFPRFQQISEKLVDMLTIDIANPVSSLKRAIKDIGLVGLMGKKNELVVSEQLISEINPLIKYTAYDICMMLLTIPERLPENATKDVRNKLEAGLVKAVSHDYTKTYSPNKATLKLKD